MKPIRRNIEKSIARDLSRKIVILAGPRQCGKTTFAKSLASSLDYFNYDSLDDRAQILRREWDRSKKLIVFDEIHKMPRWKNWLKGVYDKEGVRPNILVTGSAKLDAFKKAGDSLAGRHFYYRMHPFDLKELHLSGIKQSPDKLLETLLNVGGYPEPFLLADPKEYRRWRQTHLDLIIRQDLVEYETVRDIQSILLLVELLRSKVGTCLSINALANELQKDHKTVSRWLDILEDLFVVFKVTPYSKNIARSVKKEPKYYFYDTGIVSAGDSAKLENAVACALLKETHYLLDAEGIGFHLHFLKIKGGREIDFALIPEFKDLRPIHIEVKTSDADASPNFKLFRERFQHPKQIQLVRELKREFSTAEDVHIAKASDWLSTFTLTT